MEKKEKMGEFSMMIETSTYYRDDFLEVEIRDNGVGINESLKDEVFKPFFTTKPSGEGTGLGLSMVKDIVRYHNGDIVVDSQEGEFTSIHIKLYGKLEEEER